MLCMYLLKDIRVISSFWLLVMQLLGTFLYMYLVNIVFTSVINTWSAILGSYCTKGFSRCLSDKESACNAGDKGLIPGLGRSPGGGNGYPRQYSCLENLMDRGAWQATVQRVVKGQTQLRVWAHTHGTYILSFRGDWQSVFQSDCPILYSYQEYMCDPVSSPPSWHVVCYISDFWHFDRCIVLIMVFKKWFIYLTTRS